MQRIRDVIKNTATPSWINSVPKNFGDAAAGSLKADEWRTMATIYLPLALVSLWGSGTSHRTQRHAMRYRQILDHTMTLVSATRLACLRIVTKDRAEHYREQVAKYVGQLSEVLPTAPRRPNLHMTFHIYDFLFLFGPVHSWWCFPFERLIGMIQRIPNNHKTGLCVSSVRSSVF
jgi:hypothetical protein